MPPQSHKQRCLLIGLTFVGIILFFLAFYTCSGTSCFGITSKVPRPIYIFSNSDLDKTQNFNFEDELLEQNFLSTSVSKGQDGSIYFGSNRGIKKITPAPVKLNKHIPSVVITDVWIDNELSNQEMIAQTQALNIDFGNMYIFPVFVNERI